MTPAGVRRFLEDYRKSGKAMRCQKCGIYADSPRVPYHDPDGICFSFENGYPEPVGEHDFRSDSDPFGKDAA